MVNVQPYEDSVVLAVTVLQAYAFRRHLLVWAEMDRQMWRRVWRVWRVVGLCHSEGSLGWANQKHAHARQCGLRGNIERGIAAQSSKRSSVSGGTRPVADQHLQQQLPQLFLCALRSLEMGITTTTAGAE